MSDGAEDQRKRSNLACVNCRQSKIRCVRVGSSCQSCILHGYRCILAPRRQRSSTSNPFVGVGKELDVLEKTVQMLLHKDANVRTSRGSLAMKDRNSGSINIPQQSYSAPVPELRKRRIPITKFNDSLHFMKLSFTGEWSYNKGDYRNFLSLLLPEEICGLGERLGEPALYREFEKVSYETWKGTQMILSQLLKPPMQLSSDPELHEVCTSIYINTKSIFTHPLISPEDLLSSGNQPDPSVQKGIECAVIIFGCLSMRRNTDFRSFSIPLIESQERAAYFQAIQCLNSMRFSEPNYFKFRLCVLLLWLLHAFSAFPSTLDVLYSVLNMGHALKLDTDNPLGYCQDQDVGRQKVVWFLAVSLEYLFVIPMSCKAHTNPRISDIVVPEYSSEHEKAFFLYAPEIHDIYRRAWDVCFSYDGNYTSVEKMTQLVSGLHEEISHWRKKIPNDVWSRPIFDSTFSQHLTTMSSGNIKFKYYHTLIAIYSIPAFAPKDFPQLSSHSLSEISAAAHSLFLDAVSSQSVKGDCTILHLIGVTTTISVMLYKQLCYPANVINLQDILFLKSQMGHFEQKSRFSIGEINPLLNVWTLLVNLLSKHYEYYNSKAESNFMYY